MQGISMKTQMDFPLFALTTTALFYFILIVLILSDWRGNQDKKTIIAYLIFLTAIFLWTILMGIIRFINTPTDLILYHDILLYAVPLFLPSAFFFFTLFFLKKNHIAKYKILSLLVISYQIIVTGLIIGSRYIIEGSEIVSGEEIKVYTGLLYPIFVLYHIGIFSVSFFILFTSYKKTDNNILKSQIEYILFGIAISVYLALGTNVLLQYFGNNSWGWLGPEFSLAIVITSLYASYRYQFLDIRLLLGKIANLSFSFILSGILTLSFSLFLFQFFKGELSFFTFLPFFFLSFFIGITFFLFLRNILAQILWGREIQAFTSTLSSLEKKIAFLPHIKEVNTMLKEVFLKKLSIHDAHILSEKQLHSSEIRKIFLSRKDFVLNNEIFFQAQKREISKKGQQAFLEQSCTLLFPLYNSDNFIGVFCLGRKELSDPYTSEEIEILKKFSHTLSIIFTNLSLYEEIAQSNITLQKKVKEKTKDLQRQYKEVQRIIQQQSNLISVTAHEFRTPLSIALFQLEDTLESHKHNSEVKEELLVLQNSLDNLKELTQRLFQMQQYDLEKIELEKEEVNIIDFLEHIYEDYRKVAEEQDVQLSFEENISEEKMLSLDPSQMRQVLHNLLGNAVKFSPKGGRLILGIEEAKNALLITIQDEGHGVPDQDKKRIFEKFQTDKASMESGLGLGLYICKKIIELHGGTIWAEDKKEDSGAVFKISLPKHSVPEKTSE